VLLVHFGPLLLGTWVERGFAHKTKISTQLRKLMFAVAKEDCEKVGFFFVNFEAKSKSQKIVSIARVLLTHLMSHIS